MMRFAPSSPMRTLAPWLAAILLAIVCGCGPKRPPAVAGAAKYPDYPSLDVPATLKVAPEIRQRHDAAWQRLRNGDLRGAGAEFAEVLKQSPGFYPSETGLGYVALASREYRQAATRFSAAIVKNSKYLPAHLGQVEAQLGLGSNTGAIAAIENVLAIDPSREELRGRLDVLRLREVQAEMESGRRAREAGRLDEAQATFDHALQLSPSSAPIYRELALVDLARGALQTAETHLRRAIQLDSADAESLALLGGVLEEEGRTREAAQAFAQAVALDPRPAWKERSEALRTKTPAVALPEEYYAIPSAPTVTRGQVAAVIGVRLSALLDAAPRRVTVVATDIRSHWAATWIVPVIGAGIMDVLPNHTFLPNASVRRTDLARMIAQLLNLATAQRPADLAQWKAARPRFSDVPATHLSYPAAALAVASGAMAADGDRFALTRVATGAELVAAIDRIDLIATRRDRREQRP